MKKLFFIISATLIVFSLVACSTLSGTSDSPEKKVVLSVSNNRESEEVILAGESIVFTLDSELPDGVGEKDIVWIVNGEKIKDTGKTITVVTDKDLNLQYSAHAEIDIPVFSGMSNYSRCIAVLDMKYRELAIDAYKYVEQTREKYGVENIPGVSVSVYGKNGEIDFDLYDGYASVGREIKNTEETLHMLGSVSKPILTAAFVKLMLEDGSTLSMNQTIGDYLTEDDLDPEHTGTVLRRINLDCTLASLINHTSGIDDMIGTDMIFDLLINEKDNPFYNLAGLVINKRKPEYPYKDGWAPYKILPDIVSDYNPERGFKYSTAGYVILGMVVEKYLAQVHPGVTLSDYVNENFVLPYCEDRVVLLASEFDDDSDYEILADPNVFQSELNSLIKAFTGINPNLVKLLGINREGKVIFNFRDFLDSYNIVSAESAWTGGAFAANSHSIARFGYNLFGINVEDPTNSDVRELIDQNIGTDDFVNDRTYCYFRKNYKVNEDDSDVYMYGHNGKTVCVSNIMMYDPEADVCMAIFVDSNAPENEFYQLMREIHFLYK